MAAFVGVDLAWKAGKESGLCVLEGDADGVRVCELDALPIEPVLFAQKLADLDDEVIVAIDAPLVLGPARMSDRLLAAAYGRFGAAPYFPSEQFLSLSGFAGRDLCAELLRHDFSLDPATVGEPGCRVMLEVFPHTCHVELFALERKLSYKKGRLAVRQDGMVAYATILLAFLAEHLPPLATAIEPLCAELATQPRGRRLKQIEDQLDAVTCAYTTWHVWTYGAERLRVFGDWETGAICVPLLNAVAPAITSALEPTFP